MYKVMIVDDEIFVRIGLRSMIDWEEIGFEIIGEAGNGEAGFEKFLALKPDIVFTDIKMPKKDGFWLIEQIKAVDEQVEIILLTAYDEFQYVRKALKLQVSDYLLKAEMEEEAILQLMVAKKEEMDKKKKVCKKEEKIIVMEQEKERVLGLLLNKEKPISLLLEKLEELQIRIEEYQGVLLQFDFSSTLKERKVEREQDNSLLYACRQLIHAIFLEKQEYCFTKQFGTSITCLLLGKQMKEEEVVHRIEDVRKSLERYYQVDFKSISSYIGENIVMLREYVDWFYEESDRLFLEENGYHNCQSENKDGKEKIAVQGITTKEEVSSLVEAFHFNQVENANKILEQIKIRCKQWSGTCTNLKLCIVQFTNDFYQGCVDYGKQEENILEYQTMILHAVDLAEIFEILEDYIHHLLLELQEVQMDEATLIVKKAMSYVEKNYSEKITLEDVANHIGLSRYYFSNLFKKVNQIGFTNYLNEVRIEHAKKLIFDPKLSIVEVANLVGFQDQSYFSKIFKKCTGKTVTEYREGEEKIF